MSNPNIELNQNEFDTLQQILNKVCVAGYGKKKVVDIKSTTKSKSQRGKAQKPTTIQNHTIYDVTLICHNGYGLQGMKQLQLEVRLNPATRKIFLDNVSVFEF